MGKDEVLKSIRELFAQQEAAIQQHPDQLVAVYYGARDGFLSQPGEWTPGTDLERDEFLMVFRYLLSSSFIAAWYHLAGDKANRDKAAQSCAIVIAGLRLDPTKVFQKHMEFELNWRRIMEQEGVAPTGGAGCVGLFVIALLIGVGLAVAAII